MPTFSYTARSLNGDLRSATLDAPSRDEAVVMLKRQRLAVVKMDEATKKPKASGKVPMRDIVIFTRQFSTMINAGLPLVQALDILSKQSEHVGLQQVDARGGVRRRERAATVADAMRQHPKAFTRPVHEHGGGGRGGRHPRHDPAAPGDFLGEERPPGAQGEGRDGSTRR
jgi:type IV pilus assembly protein PilC